MSHYTYTAVSVFLYPMLTIVSLQCSVSPFKTHYAVAGSGPCLAQTRLTVVSSVGVVPVPVAYQLWARGSLLGYSVGFMGAVGC